MSDLDHIRDRLAERQSIGEEIVAEKPDMWRSPAIGKKRQPWRI